MKTHLVWSLEVAGKLHTFPEIGGFPVSSWQSFTIIAITSHSGIPQKLCIPALAHKRFETLEKHLLLGNRFGSGQDFRPVPINGAYKNELSLVDRQTIYKLLPLNLHQFGYGARRTQLAYIRLKGTCLFWRNFTRRKKTGEKQAYDPLGIQP